MANFAKRVATIFRDFAVDGVGSSGSHQPPKADIRAWGLTVETALDTLGASGGVIFATKAGLDAALGYAANTQAWVYADSTAANNGVYIKSGASGAGSWSRATDLPFNLLVATVTGGTANAIQVTTPLPVPAGDMRAVLMLRPTANNTGPVTIAVNGATAADLVGYDGAALGADALVNGAVSMIAAVGSSYRLLVNHAAADRALAAAASAAAALVSEQNADTSEAAALASQTAAAASAAAALGSQNAAAGSATAAALSATNANTSALAAASSATAAAAAASAAGPVAIYDTKAAADAALAGLANNAVVEVMADESRNGHRTRYRKESGSYVYKLTLTQVFVTSLAALAALNPAAITSVYLSLGARSGQFNWSAANLSTLVAADTLQGIYVAPSSATNGASGAWVRQFDGDTAPIEWWGGAADNSTLNGAIAQVAANVLGLRGGGLIGFLQPGVYLMEQTGASISYASTMRKCVALSYDNTGIRVGGLATTLRRANGQQTNTVGFRGVVMFEYVNARRNMRFIGDGGTLDGNIAGQTGYSLGYSQGFNGDAIFAAGVTSTGGNWLFQGLRIVNWHSHPITVGLGNVGGRATQFVSDVVMRDLWVENVGEGLECLACLRFTCENYTLVVDGITMAGDGIEPGYCEQGVIRNIRVIGRNGGTLTGAMFELIGSRNMLVSNFDMRGVRATLFSGSTNPGEPDWRANNIVFRDGFISDNRATYIIYFPQDGYVRFEQITCVNCPGLLVLSSVNSQARADLVNVLGIGCGSASFQGNRPVRWRGGGNIHAVDYGVQFSQTSGGLVVPIDFKDLAFSAVVRAHLTASQVNAANPAAPTLAEVQAAVTAIGAVRPILFYYTGTNSSADAVITNGYYWVDIDGVVRLFSTAAGGNVPTGAKTAQPDVRLSSQGFTPDIKVNGTFADCALLGPSTGPLVMADADSIADLRVRGVSGPGAEVSTSVTIVTDIGLARTLFKSFGASLTTLRNPSKLQELTILFGPSACNVTHQVTGHGGFGFFLAGGVANTAQNFTAGSRLAVQYRTTADNAPADGWYEIGRTVL